uniref:Large ribosomal subunit protein uL22 n=1 Tax=Catharanthus phyllody phytoplasma TaxID=418858 RepID=A2IAV7_9MOLU|nr:ribosomal protein L22 [Catharanthus phyllody phytoplasma]WPQ75001.1 ribosomal protein L22 [Candidatus Phytoplasma trifolii]
MKVKAVASQIPVTPRKLCLVVDLIRGQKIKEAEAILTLNSKSAAPIVLKLLKSAVANAVHNFNLNKDDLYVEEIFVNESISLPRLFPRAKGKTDKRKKRTSHIKIFVSKCKKETQEI